MAKTNLRDEVNLTQEINFKVLKTFWHLGSMYNIGNVVKLTGLVALPLYEKGYIDVIEEGSILNPITGTLEPIVITEKIKISMYEVLKVLNFRYAKGVILEVTKNHEELLLSPSLDLIEKGFIKKTDKYIEGDITAQNKRLMLAEEGNEATESISLSTTH